MASNEAAVYAERWNTLFASRKSLRYRAEDTHLVEVPQSGIIDKKKLVEKILNERSTALDPPPDFKYPALQQFLAGVDKIRLKKPLTGTLPNEIVLLDERRDTLTDGTDPKQWDMDGNPGYLAYPETGEVHFSGALNLESLIKRLSEPVNVFTHASIFISLISGRERFEVSTDGQCGTSRSGLRRLLTY